MQPEKRYYLWDNWAKMYLFFPAEYNSTDGKSYRPAAAE